MTRRSLFSRGQQPVVSVRGLKKSFGSKEVLRGVDVDIHEGESLVVIGGSGSGKSVLIKCIMGILEPDDGRILVRGQDISKLPEHKCRKLRESFGMLFQYAALFDSLPLWENVAFGLTEVQGLARRKARVQALKHLRDVGLGEEMAYRFPAEISNGMRKRVGLARAIATSPSTLFFDEPTTGLDPIMGDVIDRLIIRSIRDLGACGLTITHDIDSAKRISDSIALLYEGRIVWQGPGPEVEQTDNPYVHQFTKGLLEGPIAVNTRP